MKNTYQLASPSVVIIVCCLMGCGYTILRDFDEEARQAEWAIIDSLTWAPDLTISNIDYEYIPPRPRQDPLDQMVHPSRVRFYVRVANVGNVDFDKAYMLIFRNLNPREYTTNSFLGTLQNQKENTIPASGSHEIKLSASYPADRTSYSFTIVTNPIIQRKLIQELRGHVNDPPIPPITREFRYDNNEARITIPGWEELLHGAQQQKQRHSIHLSRCS